MRAHRAVLAVVTMTILSFPAVTLAQGFKHGGMVRDGVGQFGAHQVGHDVLAPRMMERLGLSEEQRAQIEAILAEERPAVQDLSFRLRQGHQEFLATHDPGSFDEAAATAFATAQAELHTELLVASLRTRARIHSVLTPEQAEQLDQMRGRLQGRFRGRHGGPASP